MIRASDKLSYQTVEDRLLGRPANTFLNSNVLRLRAEGKSEAEVDQWLDWVYTVALAHPKDSK